MPRPTSWSTTPAFHFIAALTDVTHDNWQGMLGVNPSGVISGVRSFLPMKQRCGEGHIVNTASGSGLFIRPEPA